MTQRYKIDGEELTAPQVWRRYVADGLSPYDFVRAAIAAGQDPVARFRAAIESLTNHPDRATIERVASEYWVFSKPGRRAGRAMMEHKRPTTPEAFWLMVFQDMRDSDPESPNLAIIEGLCIEAAAIDEHEPFGVAVSLDDPCIPMEPGRMARPTDVVWAIEAFREASDGVADLYEMDAPPSPFRVVRSLWMTGETDYAQFVGTVWQSLLGPEQSVDMPTVTGCQLHGILIDLAPAFVSLMKPRSASGQTSRTHLRLVWNADNPRPYGA